MKFLGVHDACQSSLVSPALKKKSNLNGSKSDPTRKPLCHVQKEMPEETDRFPWSLELSLVNLSWLIFTCSDHGQSTCSVSTTLVLRAQEMLLGMLWRKVLSAPIQEMLDFPLLHQERGNEYGRNYIYSLRAGF